ncbi:MAG: fibronectin type III domain-containing protein [Candidatus Shapirobacteria bacterium]|nr:fibronectin type III domain-containing protein [Candidatus Shapirobacteria bacterium]
MNRKIFLFIYVFLVLPLSFLFLFKKTYAAISWTDDFNSGNKNTWINIDGGDNSTHLFQNNKYELHTESNNGSAKSLASYVNQTNDNSIVQTRVQKINSGDNFLTYLLLRINPTTMSGYTCGVSSDGTNHFWFGKLTNGVYSNLTTTGTATYNSNDFKFRCAAIGSSLVAKVWNASDSEPSSWQISSTDNSYTSGSNGVMLATYPILGWNTVQVAVDDFSTQGLSKSEVWVDDNWVGTSANTEVESGKIFGYNAFATIQSGVSAVDVEGTVNVAAGEYNENLTITKAVNIIGANKDTTIIKGVSGKTRVLSVNDVSTTMSVRGFTINAANCDSPKRGMQSVLSSNVTFEGNKIINIGDMGIWTRSGNIIKNNNINCDIGTSFGGIYIDGAGNTISDNTINSVTTNSGISINGSNNFIKSNNIQCSIEDSFAGCIYISGIDNILDSNTITGFTGSAYAIFSYGGTAPVNQNNTFKRNTFIANNADGSGGGIYLYNSGGNIIGGTLPEDGNSFILKPDSKKSPSYGYGIDIISYPDGYTASNTIQNNKFDGGNRVLEVEGFVGGTTTFSNNIVGATTPPSNYGVIFSGGSAIISGNTFHNISTPIFFSRSGGVAEMNISITNNIFDDGADTYAAILASNFTSLVVNENSFDLKSNRIALNNQGGNVDATNNWWGSASLKKIKSKILGNVIFTPYYVNSKKTSLVASIIHGAATINNNKPQVLINDSTLPVTITVESGTTNPTLDVSSLITNNSGTLPQITINTNSANISIPESTTITSDDENWDGIIKAPTVTTITLPETSGETKTLGMAIEVGLGDTKLTFDKAVKIDFPGEVGKRVGFSRNDVFTEITTICSSDSGATLGVDEECKIDVGNDLVVWTRHFTKFIVFSSVSTSTPTPTPTPTPTSSSSTSTSTTSTGWAAPACTATKPGSAPTITNTVNGDNSITLTWSKASNPFTHYLVAYGTSSGSIEYGNPNVGNADTTSYTIRGLSGGTRYYFKIKAINDCMPGDWSNEVSATPRGRVIEAMTTTSGETTTTPAEGFVPTSEIPGNLFDIKLTIDSAILNKSNELVSRVSFTNFGSLPTLAKLVYKILDENGKIIFTENGEVTVETENTLVKEFKNFEAGNGKYTLILETIYGDNVKDEFRQSFEIKEVVSTQNRWIVLVLGIFVGIIGIVIYKLSKARKHK